ncbi:MAG: transglycosylase domain-containing protein [Lachnospiraceae bacterium]|nr:transglycosylase domain-containing protein [Lachnospiraceae bacterium]
MLDFSNHGLDNKKKQLRGLGAKATKKVNFAIFRIIVIAIVVALVAGSAAIYGSIKSIVDGAPSVSVEDVLPTSYKSYVYDSKGNLVQEVIGEQSNRIEVAIEDMPDILKYAFIDLEDVRFYEHNGIDPQGIMRALIIGLQTKDFSQGASTITQQLLKLNIFSGGSEKSQIQRFIRKFREQYLAMELEKEMTKDEILEAYLNTINMGSGCYGVEAAANYYFNKSCQDLTPNECAVLAAIAQSPTNRNPVRYPDKNRYRRNYCLKYMLNNGHITDEEYETALNDTFIYTRIALNAQNAENNKKVSSYYTEAAITQLLRDLRNKYGYTSEEASKLVYSGGIKIYLAQDPDIQAIVDRYYNDNANFSSTEYYPSWGLAYQEDDGSITEYSSSTSGQIREWYGKDLLFYSPDECKAIVDQYKEYMGFQEERIVAEYFYAVPQVQSSFVLIDQKTGYVKALTGGRGEKFTNWSLNRATQSTRQPGSVFKILSVYAPAFDTGTDTLATSKLDEIYESPTGATIHNVDNSYEGLVNLRRAIIVSKNTIATRVLNEDISPSLALDYLIDRFHFTTLDRQTDAVEVLGLGGITYGVTNYELTAGVAAVANGGIYNSPILYTKVIDHDGNLLIDNSVAESNRAIKDSTAYLLTSAMQDVVTKGTATQTQMYTGMAQAGKTGTTDDRKDLWFVGFTPYYTAGIWFGYDNNVSMSYRLSDYYAQQRLWRNIMTEIHADLEIVSDFQRPDSVTYASVCAISGKLPSEFCPVVSELFAADTMPTERCHDHFYLDICTECGGKATDLTPEEFIDHHLFNSGDEVPDFDCIHVKETEPENPEDRGEGENTGNPENPEGGE